MAGLRTHCTHKSENQASSLALILHLQNPFLPPQMAPKPDLAQVGREAFEFLETEYLPRKTRPSGPQSAHSHQPVPSNFVVIQDPPNPMTETVVHNYHYPVRVQPYPYGVRYAPVVETRNPHYYYYY